MINAFLLYHKCGNNYFLNAFRRCPEIDMSERVTRLNPEKLRILNQTDALVNVRCGGFNEASLAACGVRDKVDTRFLIATRHPASFVLSAWHYHLRGVEDWAVTEPQDALGGRALTPTLHAARDDDERAIAVMAVFKWLYDAKASAIAALADDPRARVIKTEELYNSSDIGVFASLAEFLRLGADTGFAHALYAVSPANRKDLPRHSTGQFRVVDPLSALGARARAYYDEHFAVFEEALGYR